MHGSDIKSASEFIEAHASSKINLIEVDATNVEMMKKKVANLDIPVIKGIIKCHQITYSKGKMYANCCMQRNKNQQFVAVSQSKVVNEELEVMFMKPSTTDKNLYIPNDNDVSIVHINHVVSIL